MIKIGVIGYGYSAKTFHLPLIESSEQLGFHAISTSKPEEVKLKCPSVSVYSNANDLIADSEIELVVGRSRYAAEKNLITVYTSLDCPIPGVINQKEVYHEKI